MKSVEPGRNSSHSYEVKEKLLVLLLPLLGKAVSTENNDNPCFFTVRYFY